MSKRRHIAALSAAALASAAAIGGLTMSSAQAAPTVHGYAR